MIKEKTIRVTVESLIAGFVPSHILTQGKGGHINRDHAFIQMSSMFNVEGDVVEKHVRSSFGTSNAIASFRTGHLQRHVQDYKRVFSE